MFSTLPDTLKAPRLAALALLVLAFAACKSRQDQMAVDTMAGVDTAPATAMPATPSMADADILQVFFTANSADSAVSALARTRAKSAGVKEFARTMVSDDANLNKDAQNLAQSASITGTPNDKSMAWQSEADQTLSSLKGQSGSDFDNTYLGHEVQSLQKQLDELDQNLIPSAANADLKQMLQNSRATISTHLDQARQLQQTVGGTTG
jgi:putative membrane protein